MKPIHIKTYQFEKVASLEFATGGVCFIPIKDKQGYTLWMNPNRISYFESKGSDSMVIKFGESTFTLPLSELNFIKQLEEASEIMEKKHGEEANDSDQSECYGSQEVD